MVYVELKRKELKTNWPHTSGLTADTTKTHGRQINLTAELGSTVPRRRKAGL